MGGLPVIGTEALARFEEAGYALALDEGGGLRASGPAPPAEELRALVEGNRDGLKAAILLEDPPEWLTRLFDLYWSEEDTPVRLTNPATGQAEVYAVHVSTKNICAAVAAEVGMPVLEGGERILPEVAEALDKWEGAA